MLRVRRIISIPTQYKIIDLTTDIVDGNTKIILGLVWRLIQTFRISAGLDEFVDNDVTALEPTPTAKNIGSDSIGGFT